MKKHLSRLLILISIVFLEGCRSGDLAFSGEQCSPVFVYTDESRSLIDAAKSYCNVREYEININRVGPVQGTSSKREIQYCDRCVGFKNYGEFATFAEIVRREISNDEERVIGETRAAIISGGE
jgi:hypothetical protein